ncbi:MAG: acetyl-CoA carboxylase carboxyltransferase subunit beta [Candidatus Aureabacteria bacterium]|nr:acetyl-CoA carboxylase carboxyltransferase subunit beta [Candidatus Auribacterota bacterium]
MALFRRKKSSDAQNKKSNIPDGLWIKCKGCNDTVYTKKLDENHRVCPKCGFHYPLKAAERISMTVDNGTFEEVDAELRSIDSLDFFDSKKYEHRIKQAEEKTKMNEAVVTGTAEIEKIKVAIGVMDFSFMGGSMGSVVGEKITRVIELAIDEGLPVIIFSTSGGARMQESTLSLMQMAKTSAALARLSEKGLFYISVLTDPTTGGTTASFASLGDIIIAEPGALIGFAGPRVIKQTIQQELPSGFQRSEFLLEHGLIDMIIKRENLRKTIASILKFAVK